MAKKELKTLIRVHKFELDEKQRKLGNLIRFEQALVNRKALLARKFIEEEQASKSSNIAALTFGAYVDWHVEENRRVDRAIEDARNEIMLMRDEILEAFLDMKTLEIAQENRERKELEEFERKTIAMLDEIGLTLYRRKAENEQQDDNAPSS